MEKKILLATLSLLPMTTAIVNANEIGIVTTNTLNVRSGPGQESKILFTLSRDEKVTIKSSSNGWYKIINSKNKEGWASSQYIQISEKHDDIDSKTVTENRVNMRSGPSTSYRVLNVLNKGSQVEVLSTKNDWTKVRYKGTTGYISSQYLSYSTKVKYVNINGLNVRSGPSTSYSSIGKLNKNERVEVISQDSSWSKIKFNNKTAYVSTQYLSDGKDQQTTIKYANTNNLNVRSEPSTSSSILGKLNKNEKVEVVSGDSSWSKIKYNNKSGYVSTQYLSSDKSESEEVGQSKNKKITVNSLNVRSGPSTSYSALGSLKIGNVVKPISQKNGWIEINFNNKKGYISSEYVIDTSEKENISNSGNNGGSSGNNNTSSTSYVQLNYTLNQHVDVQYAKAQKGGNKIDASLSTGSGSGYINATRSDLQKYLNPNNFTGSQKGLNQFLKLDNYKGGISVSQLNNYLNSLSPDSTGGNVFYNQGAAFINAAKKHDIDLAYFVAHAMVETGYGRSTLAKGQYVEGVKVYNFFGIAAFDGSAVSSGKYYAYKMGWTSVEKTLDGSAKWIADNYIKSSYKQNTLYKMRWSYNSPNHQYATDVNWSNLIASVMTKITNMYSGSVMKYEIPKYR